MKLSFPLMHHQNKDHVMNQDGSPVMSSAAIGSGDPWKEILEFISKSKKTKSQHNKDQKSSQPPVDSGPSLTDRVVEPFTSTSQMSSEEGLQPTEDLKLELLQMDPQICLDLDEPTFQEYETSESNSSSQIIATEISKEVALIEDKDIGLEQTFRQPSSHLSESSLGSKLGRPNIAWMITAVVVVSIAYVVFKYGKDIASWVKNKVTSVFDFQIKQKIEQADSVQKQNEISFNVEPEPLVLDPLFEQKNLDVTIHEDKPEALPIDVKTEENQDLVLEDVMKRNEVVDQDLDQEEYNSNPSSIGREDFWFFSG